MELPGAIELLVNHSKMRSPSVKQAAKLVRTGTSTLMIKPEDSCGVGSYVWKGMFNKKKKEDRKWRRLFSN